MNEQSQRELMINAAVNFGGVWPSEDKFKLEDVESDIADGAILVTHTECFEYPDEPVGSISLGTVAANERFYHAITKQEFEAFIGDLADKAPDGAEYAALSDDSAVICYYCDIEDDCYEYCYEGESHWNSNIGKPIQGPLIPLPKSEPAPWMPEVGEECEYYSHEMGESRKGLIHCEYKHGFIVIDDEDETPSIAYSHNFRPLRTEAEIEREELSGDIIRIARAITSDRFMPKEAEQEFIKLAECIYGLGYRKVND